MQSAEFDIIVTPPCSSWARALFFDKPGPPPCRDKTIARQHRACQSHNRFWQQMHPFLHSTTGSGTAGAKGTRNHCTRIAWTPRRFGRSPPWRAQRKVAGQHLATFGYPKLRHWHPRVQVSSRLPMPIRRGLYQADKIDVRLAKYRRIWRRRMAIIQYTGQVYRSFWGMRACILRQAHLRPRR